jgi:hypothetical protein
MALMADVMAIPGAAVVVVFPGEPLERGEGDLGGSGG